MNLSGKMKLLLRSVLLSSLCTLSSWRVSSEALVVSQSPDVSVSEGETVTVTCCWGSKTRVRVSWLKDHTLIKNETVNVQSQKSPNVLRNCTVLSFQGITRNDSGRYVCNVIVEIPMLTSVEGNGTTITVTAGRNRTDNPTGGGLPTPAKAVLAVLVPLFLIVLTCFCCLRRRQGRTARVIYEVPHTDSLDAEMDKQSTASSRGSSQWCQVPLYDYFERVETGGSG
ncbi:uncharacterized protein [Nothobranchius furzeri]|uniref:B- and T-lymphocyte attenuator-like n=2 Tax=Nothobranchius furzeri TaxID=105023 RepID=A0A9D2Y6N1_NOTFU|nr:B- and T-lymphocyte attenuator-like [Nothobranchius furzeri]